MKIPLSPKPVRLYMVREHLRHIPTCPLPKGLTLHWYQPGDEQAWVRIHAEAAPELALPEAYFRKEFGTDAQRLARRQCYFIDAEQRPIATATAWSKRSYRGQPHGRLHFVAVAPDWQGRRVSPALVAIACRRLRQLGHVRAYLVTDSARLRAINLYFRFGFRPRIHGAADRAAWAVLRSAVKPEWRRFCPAA